MAKKKPHADMTLEELHHEASKHEIEGRSAMSKDELVAALDAKAGGKAAATDDEAAAGDELLTLTAPAQVHCHTAFEVEWTAAEGVKDVVIAGLGKVTKSPVTMHAIEQGRMPINASAKAKNGSDVTASTSVEVIKKP